MPGVQATEVKRERGPLNGVDTPKLFATINVVKAQPELAKFQFRATNRWITGTHSRSRLETFSGASGEHRHTGEVEFHNKRLVRGDRNWWFVGAAHEYIETDAEDRVERLDGCDGRDLGNDGSSDRHVPAPLPR